MTFTIYDAGGPPFVRMLNNLAAILAKGAAHAQAKSFDPAILINARLAPDMLPLSRQVQIASDAAKGGIGRLAGIEVPSFADTEASFPELEARVAKTVAFIEGVPAEQIAGSETRMIHLKFGPREITMPGNVFLTHFALPNFYFHVTTAYAILRHNGVALGKMDYLGAE